MFTLSVLLFACSGDSESTTSTPVTGAIQSPEALDNTNGAEQTTAENSKTGTQYLETTETGCVFDYLHSTQKRGSQSIASFSPCLNQNLG